MRRWLNILLFFFLSIFFISFVPRHILIEQQKTNGIHWIDEKTYIASFEFTFHAANIFISLILTNFLLTSMEGDVKKARNSAAKKMEKERKKSRLHNLRLDKESKKGNLHVWLTEYLDWNTRKRAIKTKNEWLCRGNYAFVDFP